MPPSPGEWLPIHVRDTIQLMKARTGPNAFLTYVVIRTVIALAQIPPIRWSLRAAPLLARGWIRLTRRHLDRAIENLEASFGSTYSRREIERIAERCLAHWVMFAMEVSWAPRLLSPMTWPRYIELEDFDEALNLLLDEKGAILITGHYGQFEMTAYLLACLGFDVVAVMRPLDNDYFNRYVVESRRSHGLQLLDKKGMMEEAPSIVGKGRPLGLVADQDAGLRGMFVDFFGRPASTYKSIGLLAMRAKVPIIVGYARRVGTEFRYRIGAPAHPLPA